MMGMFDYVEVDPAFELPGLTKEERERLHFQSKSFACGLETYKIAADGTLIRPVVEYFHFYDTLDGRQWIEYVAKVIDGKVVHVRLLAPKSSASEKSQ